MAMNFETVENILKIIDSSTLEELHVEIGEIKISVRRKGHVGRSPEPNQTVALAAPQAPPLPAETRVPDTPALRAQAAAPAARQPGRSLGEGEVAITAPMVGTFYRAPAPGAPPFVDVGSLVDTEDTVCIIEVMKLMNSISAGVRGRVVDILVQDAALVEYGQMLMVIRAEPKGES